MIEFDRYYKCFRLNFNNDNIITRDGQQYLSLDNENLMFVRNFCSNGKHQDIDEYIFEEECEFINKNIYKNLDVLDCFTSIDEYKNNNCVNILLNSRYENERYLDKNEIYFGINDSVKKYHNNISLYMNNNPYDNILEYLPETNKILPNGLFSYRTNTKFVDLYKGRKFGYNCPISSKKQNILTTSAYTIWLEDHRNSLLSMFNLLFYMKIPRINLIYPKNYSSEQKKGSVYISNNVYMYPQQIIETSIISAAIFWLKKYGINVYTYNEDYVFIENLNILKGLSNG